jgi:hypothetical protein
MPLPLLGLVPAISTWVVNTLAVGGLVSLISDNSIQDLKRLILGHVVEYAAKYAGLELDPDDPISDASFSHAVSLRVGFAIRSLRDRDMIIEDLDNFAAAMISERSGFVVRSVKDVEVLKQDLQRVALAVVTERIGIPLGVSGESGIDLNPEEIKAQILAWAKAQLLAEIKASVRVDALEMAAWGDVEALVKVINERAESGQVSAHGVALKIADQLAVAAVGDYQKVVVGMTKKQRRRELNRWYQAKFRRNHGNRQKYIPIGMTASIG